jgi:hypothetical protein
VEDGQQSMGQTRQLSVTDCMEGEADEFRLQRKVLLQWPPSVIKTGACPTKVISIRGNIC